MERKKSEKFQTNAEMSVNAGVSSSSCQVLVLSIRNVLVSPCISILFSQTKVYDVDKVALLAEPHEEVIRLDVSVYQVLGMDVLHTTYLHPH